MGTGRPDLVGVCIDVHGRGRWNGSASAHIDGSCVDHDSNNVLVAFVFGYNKMTFVDVPFLQQKIIHVRTIYKFQLPLLIMAKVAYNSLNTITQPDFLFTYA